MQSVNLNLKPSILKPPKPIYKGELRLKEYSNKQKSNSDIQLLDENFELYDFYVNGTKEFNQVLTKEAVPNIGPQSCSSDYSNITDVEECIQMNRSMNDFEDRYVQDLSYIVEEEDQERMIPNDNRFVIDLSMLRESSNSYDQSHFDCSPFRNVYNYENRLDQSGAIDSVISNSVEDKILIFPQELEFQELSRTISSMDKLMFYLFGKDKYNFFQLSKQRDQFYDFPFLSIMKPLIFPGYEIEYNNEEENYVEYDEFNEDEKIREENSNMRDYSNNVNHSDALV